MIDILTLIASCANLVLLLVYPAYARLMAGVMAAQLDEKSLRDTTCSCCNQDYSSCSCSFCEHGVCKLHGSCSEC